MKQILQKRSWKKHKQKNSSVLLGGEDTLPRTRNLDEVLRLLHVKTDLYETWKKKIQSYNNSSKNTTVDVLKKYGILLHPWIRLDPKTYLLHLDSTNREWNNPPDATKNKYLCKGSILLSVPVSQIWSSDINRCIDGLNICDDIAFQLIQSAKRGDSYTNYCKKYHTQRYASNLPFSNIRHFETERWIYEAKFFDGYITNSCHQAIEKELFQWKWSISSALRCGLDMGGGVETIIVPYLYEMFLHNGNSPDVAPTIAVPEEGGIWLNLLGGVPDPEHAYLHFISLKHIPLTLTTHSFFQNIHTIQQQKINRCESIPHSIRPLTRSFLCLGYDSADSRDAWRALHGFSEKAFDNLSHNPSLLYLFNNVVTEKNLDQMLCEALQYASSHATKLLSCK